jgi:hypothetical protein
MEVVELEGTLQLQGMVVALGDVVTALEDQIVLLTMMMIDMMVGATWTAEIHIMVLGVIVMLVIAMHQQQIAILVTGIVVQIVMHQVALPGKGAMKEMEGGPAEVTTVMILGALVDMAEVVHVSGVVLVGLHALVRVTVIDLPPMTVLAGELEPVLMMIATEEGYLAAEQRHLSVFSVISQYLVFAFAILMLQPCVIQWCSLFY